MITRFEKVAVILPPNDYAIFLAVRRTLSQVGRYPLRNLIPSVTFGHLLPAQVFHLRIGKHSQHGSAHARRDLDPLLDVLSTCRPLCLLGPRTLFPTPPPPHPHPHLQ